MVEGFPFQFNILLQNNFLLSKMAYGGLKSDDRIVSIQFNVWWWKGSSSVSLEWFLSSYQ